MELDHFEIEPFVTSQASAPAAVRPARRPPSGGRRKRRGYGGGYLQVGVCVAALLLLLGLELFVFHNQRAALPASAAPTEPGTADEEALGRLQFVNGRFYSVFSPDARWSLPLSPGGMESLNDEQLLKLTATPGESVKSPAPGQVRQVGVDERYGNFVLIYHGSDLESAYYHLDTVCVEEGQPLQADDTLGTVGSDGYLYVAVLESGALQRVFRYFDAPAAS